MTLTFFNYELAQIRTRLFICLSLSGCVSLSSYLPASLSNGLPTCFYVYLRICLFIYLAVYVSS